MPNEISLRINADIHTLFHSLLKTSGKNVENPLQILRKAHFELQNG